MSGLCGRLEGSTHLLSWLLLGGRLREAGFEDIRFMPEPEAAAQAVQDELSKESIGLVVDIGGGTTDVAIWVEGCIRHSAVIPMGGHHLTSDLAIGLRTAPEDAGGNLDSVRERTGWHLTQPCPHLRP